MEVALQLVNSLMVYVLVLVLGMLKWPTRQRYWSTQPPRSLVVQRMFLLLISWCMAPLVCVVDAPCFSRPPFVVTLRPRLVPVSGREVNPTCLVLGWQSVLGLR